MRSPRLVTTLSAICAAIFLASPSYGQPAAGGKAKDPVTKTVAAADGWPIAMSYFESPAGKESPVVIMLHGSEGNRLVWAKFAPILQNEGIAVLTVDLRKHGESVVPEVNSDLRPNDYVAMAALDLKAVKKFLYTEHQAEKLNMRKTAIVAADFTAPIAVNFALADWLQRPYNDAPTLAASTPRGQDVRALVLLSPEDKVTGLTTTRELLSLRAPLWNVAFLFAHGEKDKKDRKTTERMYQKVFKNTPEAEKRMYHKTYNTAFRGTDLVGRGRSVPVEAHMLQFFKLHLKELPDQWFDRKPRI